MPGVLVIQHVPHEGLGTLEDGFKQAGLAVASLDAWRAKSWPSIKAIDGLVVMGGPQGVYEQKQYPYLTNEIALLRDAVRAKKPVLGICLGAQLLAAALGAEVRPNHSKEIGWYPVMREPGADGDPLWDAFGQTETVFQWHGDTFDLPKGATQLASAPLCEQQAFRYGSNAYGIQFHIEITEAMIRAWIVANKAELAKLQGVIDPAAIRAQIPQHISRMRELSQHVASRFAVLVAGKQIAARR